MMQVVELSSKAPEQTAFAGAIAPKLDVARTRLAELEEQVGDAVLAANLDEAGGADALANLNGALETARRDVTQLDAALLVAQNRDARSLAAFESYVRRSELAGLRAIADERLNAMVKLASALKTAAKQYQVFLDLTARMAAAWPTGINISHQIDWHNSESIVGGVSFPAPIDKIVAGEMYRLASPDEGGRRRPLPGAKPLVEAHRLLSPDAIEPMTEGLGRVNDWLLGILADKLDAIDQSNGLGKELS